MGSTTRVEGLLAVHKPTGISSAQVIRDVQKEFNPSMLFKATIEAEQERLREARKHMHKARFRKDRQSKDVKIGHGGTLDPMATGVLILGIGAGTKRLGDFLKCTKSYDTVLLFGQATDTYDVVGKTVARKQYDHITRAMVEEALDKFRGEIMQRPPIYSALRVQGKRLYEYAREGKEVPVEIQERPVTVEKLELIDWYEGGSHQFHWPRDEAGEEEKEIAAKVLRFGNKANDGDKTSLKREREVDDATAADEQPPKRTKATEDADEADQSMERAADTHDGVAKETVESTASADANASSTEPEPCPAPACLLRMTVTSGFYVRSLCHDMGEAVGSLGTMASLVRTRQGEFELGKNVFEFDELAKGEAVWGPRVQELLKPVGD
ncbi:hypothetical protein AMS68_000820 [Peltaster fructicola]|uniref:tRNA pseudouridine(55) synthase n=1 Tax=Peltaster fructicola TaxID=286661 RepID=A0A6H0XKQ2_9PEZI|nr:hypothetical protein AMS68_000820 [Peltaster fructicola]